jgi:hypothetical protein
MPTAGFSELLRADELPSGLDIVQVAPDWSSEDSLMRIRDRLDALIFDRFMRDASFTVRRIVFLEPPAHGAPQSVVSEHRHWVSGLVRDLFHLDMPGRGERAAYRIRQLIREPHPVNPQDVSDGWSDGDDREWSQGFERVWTAPGCIENNITPEDFPIGPIGDRDPRWYLWH